MKRFLIEYDDGRLREPETLDVVYWRSVVSVTERLLMSHDEVARRFPELARRIGLMQPCQQYEEE